MRHFPYTGSGPYCYANSFAMMFGAEAPPTAVIEVATGSPFGMQLIGGTLPLFDPYGWTPEAGFDAALAALGWTSSVARGEDEMDALSRLRASLLDGPVWIGPVEMGHFTHQPGNVGPIGADHYVVVIEVADDRVLMHDPQGYPYTSLPLNDFMVAWRAETISYGSPYTMRIGFRQIEKVSDIDAIKASVPAAIRWLSTVGDHAMPAGSLANGEAAEGLANLVEDGCDAELRGHLVHFAVRVGARRAADAATCLARAGYPKASGIAAEQAHIIGSAQHPLVVGDDVAAAKVLRSLAPTYGKLLSALQNEIGCA